MLGNRDFRVILQIIALISCLCMSVRSNLRILYSAVAVFCIFSCAADYAKCKDGRHINIHDTRDYDKRCCNSQPQRSDCRERYVNKVVAAVVSKLFYCWSHVADDDVTSRDAQYQKKYRGIKCQYYIPYAC